jgi:cell division protein FtsI/penicillin-binding protein 2
MNGQPTIRNEITPWRIWSFLVILGLVFGVFIVRLFVLQVIQTTSWTAKAVENSTE